MTTALAGALGAAVAASVVALAAPAHADDQVTIRGTAFPGPGAASLSFVGCSAVYDRHDEALQPFISRGQAPLGTRSLGYDLTGGNAVGSLHVVGSMTATTTASLQVHARAGSTGVAYAGYQEPADEGTNLLWFGRADLAAPAGAWHPVDATRLSYTWTKYDLTDGRRVVAEEPTPSVVADFVASRGDGPGLYTIGFGCDGGRFTMDALRVGSSGAVTTYDLEGLTSRLSVAGMPHTIRPGDPVTITGAVRSGSGSRIPHATVILEEQVQGSNRWRPVDVADADPNDASVTVRPEVTTRYRWRFVDRPAHEGSVSPVFTVHVVAETEEDVPEGSPSPAPSPSSPESPSGSPSESPSGSPSAPESPSQSPSSGPSQTPDGDPSVPAEPSESASDSESPTAVESAAASVSP